MKRENGILISNEAIFWDKILARKDLDDFTLRNERMKYHVPDINMNLRNKVVTINLWIEQIPVFGWIHRVR